MNIIKGFPKETVASDTVVAIDIEIFGMAKNKLHRPIGDFASFQMCIGEDVYIIFDVHDLKEAWNRIKDARLIVGHNLIFDIRQLRRWVKIEPRQIWCTLVMEKVLWGGYYGNLEFSLADLVRRYLDVKMDKELRETFEQAYFMTEDMISYAAQDAYYTYKVYEAQQREIEARNNHIQAYWQIEEPCIWATLDFKPVKVDVGR